jgi:dCTP deaminase
MPGPSKTALRPQSANNLRANLLKRKDQARARADGATPDADDAPGILAARATLPGLLPDHEIRRLAEQEGMIEPFCEKLQRDLAGNKIMSYGLSSYGYDARCAPEWMIFTNVDNAIVDPKNFTTDSFVERSGDVVVIPPNSFLLTRTVEYFRIPNDVLTICIGKSTYARCGLIVNVTPLEPGWEGHVTLEISNTTPLPAKVYANEGVAQFLFFKGSSPCEVTYAARAGKYQGQRGVTLPRT